MAVLRGTVPQRAIDDESGFASSSLLSLGGISTREPLRPHRSAHSLLSPLHSLLASLCIPLTPSSLAVVTPSLLLTVLEALLETRIEDVPEEWRGSWSRDHRRGIVEVLIRAIAEVQEGLTRAVRPNNGAVETPRWGSASVDIEQAVRGKEEEVAKLVAGLLEIAEAMGIPLFDESEGTVLAALSTSSSYHVTSHDQTPCAYPRTSTLPAASAPLSQIYETPTPSALFAPRPLHPPRPRSPPALNRRSTSALSASTSAASSASLRSSHTQRTASTSLTVPSHLSSSSSHSSTRPSLLSELSKSGYLSPPPGSPRRARSSRSVRSNEGEDTTAEIRSRSTLELMKRLATEQEKEKGKRAVADTRRINAVAPEANAPRAQAKQEKERDKGKGRELLRPRRPSLGEDGDVNAGGLSCGGCCESCGVALRLSDEDGGSSSASSSRPDSPSFSTSTGELPSASRGPSHDSHQRSLHHARRRPRATKGVPACTCQPPHQPQPPAKPPQRNSSHSRHLSRCSSSSLTVDPSSRNAVPLPTAVRRIRVVRPFSTSSSTTATEPTLPDIHHSPAASRSRNIALRRALADADAADLSIHGESEIEAFERLHLGHSHSSAPPTASSPLSDSAHPQLVPSTPPPASTSETTKETEETPSPYTLMLLAQRDRLKEKLEVLRRRERDRVEAGMV
ncbi:hypothetical protein JCM11641_007127 [Rhodosporidiobolus odoratus]